MAEAGKDADGLERRPTLGRGRSAWDGEATEFERDGVFHTVGKDYPGMETRIMFYQTLSLFGGRVWIMFYKTRA